MNQKFDNFRIADHTSPKLVLGRRAKIAYMIRVSILVVFSAITAILNAQSKNTASGQPLAEIDLKPLGVKAPAKGSVSHTAIELLFISDRCLVLLEENNPPDASRQTRLNLYEIGDGGVRPAKTLNLGEAVLPISSSQLISAKVLERIDSDHFAYWTYRGKADRWVCDSDLNCRDTEEGPTAITSPHSANCTSDELLGFIDAERAVCLVPRGNTKWSVVVMDSSGHHLYGVDQKALPWDAKLVSSVQGQRFGLEWESNTGLQRINPVACVDECPPAGTQHLVVFNSSDGKELAGFRWDPRPYNLRVLPALSPSGKIAAFVRADKLAIYSLY